MNVMTAIDASPPMVTYLRLLLLLAGVVREVFMLDADSSELAGNVGSGQMEEWKRGRAVESMNWAFFYKFTEVVKGQETERLSVSVGQSLCEPRCQLAGVRAGPITPLFAAWT